MELFVNLRYNFSTVDIIFILVMSESNEGFI